MHDQLHTPAEMASSRHYDFIVDEFKFGDLEGVTALFQAYAASLGLDLSFQNFTQELESLPGKYSPPNGSLLVARRKHGKLLRNSAFDGNVSRIVDSNGSEVARSKESGPPTDAESARVIMSETAGGRVEGELLGCVCLRELPNSAHNPHVLPSDPDQSNLMQKRICEMKRLYVSPSARGTGLGRALADSAIARARQLQYHAIRLDTLPSMTAARRMYERLGFREIEKYYETPLEGTIFLELDLTQ